MTFSWPAPKNVPYLELEFSQFEFFNQPDLHFRGTMAVRTVGLNLPDPKGLGRRHWQVKEG